MSEQSEACLLAISVGPVQDFIAASRKARDLWFGSHLLSDLSRAAAQSLQDDGAELIFPPPASLAQGESVANKILVSTMSNPAELAGRAKVAVDQRIETYWNDDVATRLTNGLDRAIDGELAAAQRQDFLEWYAAWVPYDPDDYAAARVLVERILAGRKALRDFDRAAGVEGRPKSSLDPARESVLVPDTEQAAELARKMHIKPGETLDAISLIKRLGGENRFVSTARVAIDPFIREAETLETSYVLLLSLLDDAHTLASTELAEEFRPDEHNGLAHYGVFPYDTQLFYDLSPDQALRQLDPWKSQIERYDQLSRAVQDFIHHAEQFRKSIPGMGAPPAYFAVVRADGDRMGKALNTLTSRKAHIAFSERMGAFAGAADDIVAKHYGAMIYSGGDDVLAFLPLDTALPCADALRLKFEAIMREALQDHPGIDLPTLSVGIAIGHFSDHLQHLLQRSGTAERAAKQPRNALAVSFESRSGGGDSRTVVHSWTTNPVYSTWAFAIELHRHNALPDGAVYELDRLRREFAAAWQSGVFGSDAGLLHRVLRGEVERILSRKRSHHGAQALDAQLRADLLHRLDSEKQDGVATLAELQTLIDELLIARRIARVLPDSARTARELWQDVLQPVAAAGAAPSLEGATA